MFPADALLVFGREAREEPVQEQERALLPQVTGFATLLLSNFLAQGMCSSPLVFGASEPFLASSILERSGC
jgi:hypothetical protein